MSLIMDLLLKLQQYLLWYLSFEPYKFNSLMYLFRLRMMPFLPSHWEKVSFLAFFIFFLSNRTMSLMTRLCSFKCTFHIILNKIKDMRQFVWNVFRMKWKLFLKIPFSEIGFTISTIEHLKDYQVQQAQSCSVHQTTWWINLLVLVFISSNPKKTTLIIFIFAL